MNKNFIIIALGIIIFALALANLSLDGYIVDTKEYCIDKMVFVYNNSSGELVNSNLTLQEGEYEIITNEKSR